MTRNSHCIVFVEESEASDAAIEAEERAKKQERRTPEEGAENLVSQLERRRFFELLETEATRSEGKQFVFVWSLPKQL